MSETQIEIDRLINLTGEDFFKHIEQQYGKLVTKILKYNDIDRYTILNHIDKHQLIDFFEKPIDEYCTDELLNLKKEICNISQGSITLKVGTKTKIKSLLKSTQFIIKKKKKQVLSEVQSNRLDNQQLSLSSTNNSSSDNEPSEENYRSNIEESMGRLLKSVDFKIHGTIYTDISVKDFKVIIENISNYIAPTCLVECICNERIRLYLKNNRFQLSNFTKHVKLIKNKSTLSNNDENQQMNVLTDSSNQMNSNGEASQSEINRLTTQNYRNENHTSDDDVATSVTTKKR